MQKPYVWTVGIFFLGSIGLVFQNCSNVNFGAPSAQVSDLTFNIAQSKASLAVSNGVCVHCHSVIVGNYVTDLGYSGNAVDFLNQAGIAGSNGWGQGEFLGAWGSYGSRTFAGTTFMQGTIMLPRVPLSARAQTEVAISIHDSKNTMVTLAASEGFGDGRTTGYPNSPVLQANAPENVTSAAAYLNSAINYRTTDYLNVISNWAIFTTPKPNMNVDTQIREVKAVTIGAPNAAMIRALLPSGQKMNYIPNNAQSPALSNFALAANGLYYTNSPSAPLVCDGDLIVDAAIFLNSLQVQTLTGCRIYATGSIFVQAAAGTGARAGIAWVGTGSVPNLQLSSAVEIAMGIGACGATSSLASRMAWDSPNAVSIAPEQTLSVASADYNAIVDGSGNKLLQDASPTCAGENDPGRAVTFEHVLLNAPRIDSRYTGDFTGIIITKFMLWSRGMFRFQYDASFEKVKILPELPAAQIFSVTDCQSGGVDHSTVLDTKFRSCN
jgi:hypothetical protein